MPSLDSLIAPENLPLESNSESLAAIQPKLYRFKKDDQNITVFRYRWSDTQATVIIYAVSLWPRHPVKMNNASNLQYLWSVRNTASDSHSALSSAPRLPLFISWLLINWEIMGQASWPIDSRGASRVLTARRRGSACLLPSGGLRRPLACCSVESAT